MSPKLHSVTFDKNTDTKPTSLAVDPTHGSLIVDETFDSNRTDSYHLSLEVSNWDVSYAVLDTLNNKYLAL
ncbi:MAG: hypothetical protein JKX73_01540, partial [Flavobacteriales bacterium]|nr:hypothetical protein [Flavobacteriales bacterium]